jgi:hypothetical protein
MLSSRATLTTLLLAAVVSAPAAWADEGRVRINDRDVPRAQVVVLERVLGAPIPPGRYWYDARSGLGGPWGHAARIYAPGFDFGRVPVKASGGNTGIYYNGRELNRDEARFLAALFGIPEAQIPAFAGYYRLEATGDVFAADGSYRGNLAALAQLRFGGGGGGSSGGCTAVRIPSSAPSPTGVKQTIDVATGSGC